MVNVRYTLVLIYLTVLSVIRIIVYKGRINE